MSFPEYLSRSASDVRYIPVSGTQYQVPGTFYVQDRGGLGLPPIRPDLYGTGTGVLPARVWESRGRREVQQLRSSAC